MALYDLPEMRKRLAVLDAQRDSLVRLIAAVENYEGSVGSPAKAGSDGAIHRNPLSTAARAATSVMKITEDLAMELIEAANSPVQTSEVLRTMQQRGLPLPNKNHLNVVSARLSNSERLEGRRGVGWWPKGRPWPGEETSMFQPSDADRERDEDERANARDEPATDGV